jgi:hypothetical protein
MGVGSQRDSRAALPPRKIRYTLYRRLGGPQGQTGQVRKISLQPGFEPRTVQLIYCILYPRNTTKLNARNNLDPCILYTSNFTNVGIGNVTSYTLGSQDIKLHFGFDPQPTESVRRR